MSEAAREQGIVWYAALPHSRASDTSLSIMKRDAHTIFKTLARCLKLRCPVCGDASVVQRPFHVKHRCDACGALFKREEGFFVGAIMANVVTTEVSILVMYFVLLLARFGDQTILTVLFVMAIGFPLAFTTTPGRFGWEWIT